MVVALKTLPPSDDVIPALAHVRLLRRGPGPLGFRSGGLACGGALPETFWRSLCKGCLRFFPLNTDPVTRGVVAPAATALRLFPRGSAPTGEAGANTRDAPGGVSAVTLRVSEALAAFALQGTLWRHVRLHRHSQTAEFGDRSDRKSVV